MKIIYFYIFVLAACQFENFRQFPPNNRLRYEKLKLLIAHYNNDVKIIQKQILIPANVINKQSLLTNKNKIALKFHQQIGALSDPNNSQQQKQIFENNPNILQFPKKSNKTKTQFYCGGIYRSMNSIPPPKNDKNKTERQQLVSTIYGFDMYVDRVDSAVSRHIKMIGTWQPSYINLIGHIVNPGYNVLNLGSQSGLQALVMGKIIGQQGKMYIFQPYSVSNKIVNKNIQLNGLKNFTTIYKIGASDIKGSSAIMVSYENTGGSQIHQQLKKQLNKTDSRFMGRQIEQVQLDLVDNLLPKNISLDFALIDVQKMQVKALKGMKQIIKRSPNLVIMCEWQYSNNPQKNKEETLQLLKYFVDLGYGIYNYRGGQMEKCKIGKFKKYQTIEQLLNLPPYNDIFFIPKNHPILYQ